LPLAGAGFDLLAVTLAQTGSSSAGVSFRVVALF
jgi:hypothetical protein